ncbi:hypothetical protein HKD37_20G056752 [Glycine soja]
MHTQTPKSKESLIKNVSLSPHKILLVKLCDTNDRPTIIAYENTSDNRFVLTTFIKQLIRLIRVHYAPKAERNLNSSISKIQHNIERQLNLKASVSMEKEELNSSSSLLPQH